MQLMLLLLLLLLWWCLLMQVALVQKSSGIGTRMSRGSVGRATATCRSLHENQVIARREKKMRSAKHRGLRRTDKRKFTNVE